MWFCGQNNILVNLDTAKISAISYESKAYIVWLKIKGVDDHIKGVLYDVTDSIISVGSSIKKADYLDGSFTIAEYPISQVERVMIRPYGKIGVGATIGFMSGALLGGILYGNSGGDPFFLILIYLPGTVLSTLIGTVAGTVKKVYHLDNYSSVVLSEELRKYCLSQ